jgi:acyl-coenzyme A synthetase/AMP-(fatty) acid ligase
VLVLLLRLEQNQEFTDSLKEEIIARNRRLPDFKRVGGYLLRGNDFPRTASMKIKRTALAEEVRKSLDRAAVVDL